MKHFILSLCLTFYLFSCSDEFDGKDGLKTDYFPNTNRIYKTCEYRHKKRHGVLKEYHKNGKLRVYQHYYRDILTDSSIFYHPNGKLAAIQFFHEGQKDKCWKKYNKDGQLYSEVNFKDGRLDSTSTIYTYRTGRVLKRINYASGLKHGKQEYFYNNGKPKCILYYKYDNLCTGTEEWHESGEKINNDFIITVTSEGKAVSENSMKFIIRLENFQEGDQVYRVNEEDTGRVVTTQFPLLQEKDHFILNIPVYKGGAVIQRIKLAAFRKTKMGNEIIKTVFLNIGK